MKHYSLKQIDSKNAQYNIIIGERSNGKTYACLKKAVKNYIETGKQTALIRRWKDDFSGKRAGSMFDALTANGEIEKITKCYTMVHYFSGKWYLANKDSDGNIYTDVVPFCYAFSLTSMEHDKSTSYPNVTTVIFDEFLSRSSYIPDEFMLFMNTLSTIIRHRNDVKIYMLGNTVNKYCPYFVEMGLSNIKTQKQGTIDIYKYGESELTVAVEYCEPSDKKGKKSNLYFAFDNPKLQMITTGTWELALYPHIPCKVKPKDIMFIFFIDFDKDLLQCEVIANEEMSFIYIHRKTTPLKNPLEDLIYTTDFVAYPNYARNILKPTNKVQKKICEYFVKDKIFYQDNEVGEILRNYLIYCKKGG